MPTSLVAAAAGVRRMRLLRKSRIGCLEVELSSDESP
jgi:hypothetical protein